MSPTAPASTPVSLSAPPFTSSSWLTPPPLPRMLFLTSFRPYPVTSTELAHEKAQPEILFKKLLPGRPVLGSARSRWLVSALQAGSAGQRRGEPCTVLRAWPPQVLVLGKSAVVPTSKHAASSLLAPGCSFPEKRLPVFPFLRSLPTHHHPAQHTVTETEQRIVEERVRDLVSDNLLNFCFLVYKMG